MIVDVFPKAGGTPLTMKTEPYVHRQSFTVPRTSSSNNTYFDSLSYYHVSRQQMAPGTNDTLYLIGEDYNGAQEHFAKIVWSPLTGYNMEWVIHSWSNDYKRVIADTSNCAYVVYADGTMKKFSPDGEELWSVSESGVLCIGANGNLFVWTATYIREYDSDGTVLNTWNYTCTGTPITFYVNADNEFFIVTSSQLARLTSDLTVAWTYAASFSTSSTSDTLGAIDIDVHGNFYMYGSSNLSVKCINSDGQLVWATGELSYSDMYMTIFVDNIGSVYATSYAKNMYKLDAATGKTLKVIPVHNYTGHRTGCADNRGNVYVWNDYEIAWWHQYLGTVNWTEDKVTKEKFILQEVERGDGYMILLSDEEVTAQ